MNASLVEYRLIDNGWSVRSRRSMFTLASDGTLSPEECAAFGVTPDEARETSSWLLDRVGYVLGANGRGGSGIFVETSDGGTALLTARHVIVPAVLSGEVTVARYVRESSVARSVEPVAIRMASRVDAALLRIRDAENFPRLAHSEWDPSGSPPLSKGMGVIAAGAPGKWKSEPDAASRVIESMKTLFFWTAVIDPNHDGPIQCDVDDGIKSLPSTFAGMSGGPVIDTHRRLVGINKGEDRDCKDGYLYVTPRRSWDDLYSPFMPADLPTDYVRQEALLVKHARPKDAAPDEAAIDVAFRCEFFWSPTSPGHQYGEFGRIVAVVLGNEPTSRRYVINTESIFYLPSDHDNETRRRALEEEAFFLLESMRYETLPDGES